jgi:hypothetical protein
MTFRLRRSEWVALGRFVRYAVLAFALGIFAILVYAATAHAATWE